MDAQPLSPVGEAAVSRFAEQVFAHLGRSDQRRWARAYLQGLLSVPGRKSLANMAAGLASGPTAAATVSLSLQQFVNGSTWDWRPARRVLAGLAAGPRPVRAWTAALVVVPKRGDQVVGVHRRFDARTGRTVKCQAASGLFVATDRDAVPVDWSLLLDPSWTDEPQRRARARIPGDVAPLPAGELLVGMVDRLAAHHPVAPLVAGLDAAEDPIRLAAALARRSVPYVLEVRGGQAVRPVLQATTGRHGRVHQGTVPAESLFPRRRPRTSADPQPVLRGTPVLPPGPATTAAPVTGTSAAPVHRLWARCDGDGGPRRYWLTDLAEDAPGVLALLDAASATRSTVDRLGSDFGLLDFSGRSYTGWHHHMTLVSAAYALGRDLAVRAGGSGGTAGTARAAGGTLRDSA
ncbi:transposase [Kitasatospora purpeofusca]|uniref:IS701 family transposase n=1 Tax=Kitasatospora purpeofusca TaxID=67352 RepID=UPI002A59A587|nr:transposase [Kitasatospora purpeofusca]MDY0813769.1 transposase [Kitasatospora purpeofusca]